MAPDVAVEAGSADGSNVTRVNFERKLEALERMMGIKEVAEVLGAGATWVHRETRKGNLPGIKIAGKYRFKPSDLQRWIDEQGKKRAG